ncbi:MAG: MarC family protein [Candidatus Omnitrophica bacterium]|nr:MarC family protein [Candidatus Omnitrophota bacterium]
MLGNILLAFIPVFVAVDPIGLLPVFVALTHRVGKKERKKVIIQSIATALSLAVAFIFLGKWVFRVMGITVGDFMIAGGGILMCISINELLQPGKQRRLPPGELGAVPLGTPLIVGPAVLTTSLIIIEEYGLVATLFAVVLNVLLVGLTFIYSDLLIKALGQSGARALSKVMALFLAAIAVMMIRKGVVQLWGGV